jgi:hypothetical protein
MVLSKVRGNSTPAPLPLRQVGIPTLLQLNVSTCFVWFRATNDLLLASSLHLALGDAIKLRFMRAITIIPKITMSESEHRILYTMKMSRDGGDGGIDGDHEKEDCAILHTRDVSLLSSLSSYDNDDDHYHLNQQQHQKGMASPLRGPIHASSLIASLDLPHLDIVSSKNRSSSSYSSLFIDSKCRNDIIVHRRLSSSTLLKKKDNSDKNVKKNVIAMAHIVATSSTSTSPPSSLPGAQPVSTNKENIGGQPSSFDEVDDNYDTASLCSVPHLMRTCDSQDDEEDCDVDYGIDDNLHGGHNDDDDINDYTGIDDVEEVDMNNNHPISSRHSSHNKSIDIVTTNNGIPHHGFGTEVTRASSTLLAFSLSSLEQQALHPSCNMASSHLHQQQEQQSQLAPLQQQIPNHLKLHQSQQHRQEEIPLMLLPPPPQNTILPQTITPIVCNRRQKIKLRLDDDSITDISSISSSNIDYRSDKCSSSIIINNRRPSSSVPALPL